MSEKYEKLKTLLMELFQLDQPDLDFGFYRIMHARSEEVSQFLDKDLFPQVKDAFVEHASLEKATIEGALANAIQQAQSLGATPDDVPKVKELRARLADDAAAQEQLEAEVYDHLRRFFRRYYSEGDFLSKQVYKPGVYAIPYEGEEVKLHWANADQYYIKTTEYFRDYTFQLRPPSETNPMRVHFRLVDATEGEHGNVKEQVGKERRFKLAPLPFVSVEDGEMVVRFTYKLDPKSQKELNTDIVSAIRSVGDASLANWRKELEANHVRADGTVTKVTRLEAHLDRYTSLNTFDYFIHKDLGGFLRRELDFYIKNEVMHLDDVENESVPRVEQYLSKIKVIRRIAGKIITFLAQLEDFQRRLWLKKKFVVGTSYCIRLGIIPEEFYPEILGNDAQIDEWVRLCAIDEIKGDLATPGYCVPLTVDFLKGQRTLFVDTRHFGSGFTGRLLESIDGLDDQVDGILLHSENFQALTLAQARYSKQVNCIYIDPPYNTGDDGFLYKDSYPHSSWATMMDSRLVVAKGLLAEGSLLFCSSDRHENHRLRLIAEGVFGERAFVESFVWIRAPNPSNLSGRTRQMAETVLCLQHGRSSEPFRGELLV